MSVKSEYRVIDEASFRVACRAIAWKQPEDGSATDWLPEAYGLISEVLDQGDIHLLEGYSNPPGSRGRRPVYENPFRLGLQALQANSYFRISRQVLSAEAARMHFAYSHYVPKEFVTGFLRENSSLARAANPDDFDILPGFMSWVAHAMANDDNRDDEFRLVPPQQTREKLDVLNGEGRAMHKDSDEEDEDGLDEADDDDMWHWVD